MILAINQKSLTKANSKTIRNLKTIGLHRLNSCVISNEKIIGYLKKSNPFLVWSTITEKDFEKIKHYLKNKKHFKNDFRINFGLNSPKGCKSNYKGYVKPEILEMYLNKMLYRK